MTAGTFHDQTILVTGAGGFIGSALVQALAQSSPRLLLLLDSCERNLFELNGRTAKNFPVPHQLILGSIDDALLLTENLLKAWTALRLSRRRPQACRAARVQSLRRRPDQRARHQHSYP